MDKIAWRCDLLFVAQTDVGTLGQDIRQVDDDGHDLRADIGDGYSKRASTFGAEYEFEV